MLLLLFAGASGEEPVFADLVLWTGRVLPGDTWVGEVL